LVLLVRSGYHTREHWEQRRPRGGGHSGRFSSTNGRQQRVGRGRRGRGRCAGAAIITVGRCVAHLSHPHFLLPFLPAVFGSVQIPVLVEH